jgi:elongation factor G-like protein
MNERYPIEQLARSVRTRFQSGFAHMTMQLMPVFEGAALEPATQGLRILGINEMALAAPRDFIRRIHEHQVRLDEPRVRDVRYGQELREPVMCIRVSIDAAHAEAAIHDLVTRNSSIDCVNWLHDPVVIQAKAPLRTLLGYPDTLAHLSQRTADLKMWLSHYAPMTWGPDDDAA